MSFSPFAILTAEEMNDLVENIEALSAGTGFGTGVITAPSVNFGGAGSGIWWEEIGRTAIGVAGDTISIPSIPVRKYLQLQIFVGPSGSYNNLLRFNNDSGSNYAYRESANGGADVTATSQSSIQLAGAVTTRNFTYVVDIINVAATEKVGYVQRFDQQTNGAGTAPSKSEIAFKWANTANQITRVDLINSSTGDFAAGSEVVVLGHD
jgi:hypothetical protein